jgi:hypothetical protein
MNLNLGACDGAVLRIMNDSLNSAKDARKG